MQFLHRRLCSTHLGRWTCSMTSSNTTRCWPSTPCRRDTAKEGEGDFLGLRPDFSRSAGNRVRRLSLQCRLPRPWRDLALETWTSPRCPSCAASSTTRRCAAPAPRVRTAWRWVARMAASGSTTSVGPASLPRSCSGTRSVWTACACCPRRSWPADPATTRSGFGICAARRCFRCSADTRTRCWAWRGSVTLSSRAQVRTRPSACGISRSQRKTAECSRATATGCAACAGPPPEAW